jgi:hypothetical protein
LLGITLSDVLITRHEIDGLMAGLLVSRELPRGRNLFGDWLDANASQLGQVYASELERHFY